jgi:hypothetical protein
LRVCELGGVELVGEGCGGQVAASGGEQMAVKLQSSTSWFHLRSVDKSPAVGWATPTSPQPLSCACTVDSLADLR